MPRRGELLTRRRSWPEYVAGAALLVIALTVGWYAFQKPSMTGDSVLLVRSSPRVVSCLEHGVWTRCFGSVHHGKASGGVYSRGPFPLFQFIPAVVLTYLGASVVATLHFLVATNFASLLAIFALAYFTVKRLAPPLWTPVIVIVLLASPLLFYGRIAFGEALAAALILAAVAGVLLEVPALLVFGLVLAACLTKETNPPFVFALTVVCSLARDSSTRTRRRQLTVIALGTACGVILNTAFNLFRYGTFTNAAYDRPGLRTFAPATVSRVFLVQWFAPNGGVVWFWPLAPALIFGVAIVVLRRRREAWTLSRVAVPLIAILLLAQLVLLSTWFSPFGWYSWGPRLLLPLVPAMLVATCVLGSPYATHAMARFLRSWALLPVALATIVLGLVEVLVVLHEAVISEFFGHRTSGCTRAVIANSQSAYYRCFFQAAWSRHPTLPQLGLRGFHATAGPLVALAFIAAVVSLVLIARRAAASEPAAPSDPERDLTEPDVEATIDAPAPSAAH